MPVDPTMVAAAASVGRVLLDIGKLSAEPMSRALAQWRTNDRIKEVAKSLAAVERVKTFVTPEKACKIKDFYLPPRFSYDDGKPFHANRLSDFGTEEHPLIEGTAGHGKSIFLRHLYVEEMRAGTYLPLFVELRKMTSPQPLAAYLAEQLQVLNFPKPDHIFEFLANDGRLLVLFDAYDELRDDLRAHFVSALEDLARRFPKLRFAITTRPESAITGLPFLRTVKIQPLNAAERENLIRKLCSLKTAENLIAGLKKNQRLSSVAITPLFVTLLCVAYRAEPHIPETTHEFFDLVFNTLLYRHDSLKPGYQRPRKSGLGNHQFALVFETFCFLATKERLMRMKSDVAASLAKESLSQEAVSTTSADKLLDDIIGITCLLVRDGVNEVQFIHKSIQEYFAARYIARLPDEAARRLYSRILEVEDRIPLWDQVIRFLREIDPYRQAKHFELPGMAQMFAIPINQLPEAQITTGVIRDLLGTKPVLSVRNDQSWIVTYGSRAFRDGKSYGVAAHFAGHQIIFDALSNTLMLAGSRQKLMSLQNDPAAEAAARAGDKTMTLHLFLDDAIAALIAPDDFLRHANSGAKIQALRMRARTLFDMIARVERRDALLDI